MLLENVLLLFEIDTSECIMQESILKVLEDAQRVLPGNAHAEAAGTSEETEIK